MRSPAVVLPVYSVFAAFFASTAHGQKPNPVAILLSENQYNLKADGSKFLLDEAQRASFFLLGELHGENEIPAMIRDLWPSLWKIGYRHVAAELSPWAAGMLEFAPSRLPSRGGHGLWRQQEADTVTAFRQPGESVLWGCDIEEVRPQDLIHELALKNPTSRPLKRMDENRAVLSGTGQFIPASTATPQVASIDPTLVAAQFPSNRWNSAGYDAAGNVNALDSKTFTYDGENRLLTAAVFNMPAISYAYDGEGRRVQKTVGSAVTTYVYDAAGQLSAEYCSGDAGYCAASSDSGTSYLVADHLGSTRLVVSANTGNPVKRRYDYLPFGEEIPAGMAGRPSATVTQQAEYSAGAYPINPPYRGDLDFTGKERDAETGLDFFGARYMSSAQGRFTSPDAAS